MRNALALGLILLSMGAGGCDGCNPDPPPVVPTTQTVSGPGWTAEIPVDWQEREPGLYVGANRANLLVTVKEVPLPVALLTDSIKKDLVRQHQDIVFDVERGLNINGLSLFELRSRYTSPGGKRVVQHQLIGEGGKSKYILTLSVVEDFYPDHRADFDKITASFRGEFHPLTPRDPPAP